MALVSVVERNSAMEVSLSIDEAELSLKNTICHERCSECRSTHRDLEDLLHNNDHVSRLKMTIGSRNSLGKDCLDSVSIGSAMTKSLTEVSDGEDVLETENDLANGLFE